MTGGIDIAALKAALAAAEAKASDAAAEIAFLRLTIEKLRRELYGWRSERKSRLLDQLELQLDELEASATEDELAAEQTAAGTTEVEGFTRRKPARKPFPAHLPRERVVVPPPTSCACCGSDRLSKITATFRRKDGRTLHVRKATRAEPEQQKIFRALGTDPAPGGIRKMIV